MIRFTTGDILGEDAEALVNTVNCVGVMGRGVALQFKKAFPQNFRAYAEACRRGEVRPGRMFVFETGALTNPRYIINFPTKRHWRGGSRIGDIEDGLEDLKRVIRETHIRSLAVPPLGSGLGGLRWADVRQRIEKALGDFNSLGVVVFEPQDAPDSGRRVHGCKVPVMTPGRAVLIGLVDRYMRGLLDPFITLLEVHKLMYFMQVAGEPLRLDYTQGPYGPYAQNLRHVLHEIEGHYISGYSDGGDTPSKPLALVPGATEDAVKVLSCERETLARFNQVAHLIEGFESEFGLELLATVHWVLKHKCDFAQKDLVSRVHGWNARKKRFSPRQIELAANVLTEQGWVPA